MRFGTIFRRYLPSLGRRSRSPQKSASTDPSRDTESAGDGYASNRRINRALRLGGRFSGTSGNAVFDRAQERDLDVSSHGDARERAAEDLVHSKSDTSVTDRPAEIDRLTDKPGKTLPPAIRAEFERDTGQPLDDVRVHSDKQAAEAAALFGADAFTHGRDVYLRESASIMDRSLMQHELAHTVLNDDSVQRREATWLERRAWLGFYDHYLPKKFLNNYMDDTGNPITLTKKEMEDCNPVNVNIRQSAVFRQTLSSLLASGGGTVPISCTALAGAMTNGTLGNFTVRYVGMLTVDATSGDWSFIGMIQFIDYWDFNVGGGNRPVLAEAKVRIANALLPGSPFHIDSVPVPATQTQADGQCNWTTAVSVPVPEHLFRGGSDIATGAEAGGVGGDTIHPDVGGAGVDVGGEAGAQSNADI